MAFEVKVPSVGESVQEGMFHEWHVSNGDFVEQDDVLVELETDKATVEIVAEVDGVVSIVKNKGDAVSVGDVIATIDTDAKGAEKSSDKKAANGNGHDKSHEEDDETQDQEKQKEPASSPSASVGGGQTQAVSSEGREGVLSPAARKMAVEHGLDTANMKGSGRGGRVTKEDIQSKLANGNGNGKDKAAKESSAPAKSKSEAKAPAKDIQAPKMNGSRDTRREKMSMIRKSIARHLVNSQQTAAMLTTFNDVDMSAVLDLRKKYKDSFKEKYGVSLGFMGFFLKASVEAIKEFPAINAYVDGEEIIYHDYCDIGVAVSTQRGLMVPVIRNVEMMSLEQIELSVSAMANKGREGKISLDDLNGGTFTVSNGGVFGSLMSTPILNAPQSAILGMHRIEQRPVVVDGEIKARPMMYLALSYDHRIVDGKEAVQFLVKIKEGIEDPNRLLIGV